MDTKFTWLKDGNGNKKLLQDLHHVSDVLLLQSGWCFRTRKQYLVILFFSVFLPCELGTTLVVSAAVSGVLCCNWADGSFVP